MVVDKGYNTKRESADGRAAICAIVCFSIYWKSDSLVAVKALDGVRPRSSFGEEPLVGWVQDSLDLAGCLGSQERLTNLTSQSVAYCLQVELIGIFGADLKWV